MSFTVNFTDFTRFLCIILRLRKTIENIEINDLFKAQIRCNL